MTEAVVTRLVDPVCGMSVRLGVSQEAGLTLEYHGTLHAFCGQGCLDAFAAEPRRYAEHPRVAAIAEPGSPVIDEGMRRWYDSCSCCLSDAYPEVKAALDAERQAIGAADPAPGICEVAEAGA
jgi:YHS domain-containing protein